MILGIDEVGRGAWAGPLVVGAVVLNGEISGLTDSKVLSAKKREEFDRIIRGSDAVIGLGWVEAAEIDEIGLGPSLRLATKRAVQAVQEQKTSFHEIIIDGTINFLSDTPLERYVTTIKKADLLIPSVSAASIVAKVARDRYMIEQHDITPAYNYAAHVGYGTAHHRAAIERHGVSELHRLSIAPLRKYASSQSTARREPVVSTAPTTRTIGDKGEAAAVAYLEANGHTISARNWKTRWCEIDIVSEKAGVLYFTEVKHRKSTTAGGGMNAITNKKLKQMTFAARSYAHMKKLQNTDLRLMAIATSGDPPSVQSIVELD